MTPEPSNALSAIWAKHDIAQLLTVYEDEIERSGCFPFQEDREEWHGSGWHAFEIRDEILRRFNALSPPPCGNWLDRHPSSPRCKRPRGHDGLCIWQSDAE